MLRGIPRSLVYAAQNSRRVQFQWQRGYCCAAAPCSTDSSSEDATACLGVGGGAMNLRSRRNIARPLPLPQDSLAVRSISSRQRRWSGELVVPEMDGELPSNLKIDPEVVELIEENRALDYDDDPENGNEDGESVADEVDEEGEREDDAEAAALEHTLAPLEEAQTRVTNTGIEEETHAFLYANTDTDVEVLSWTDGSIVSTRTLDPSVFGVPVRRDVVHDVIRWQLARRRKGNAKTKRIGEIRGSGRKVRPQKGQGRARAGHSRPPHWRGGAKAHGPRVRDWSYKLNKKFKKLGLRCALSARLREGKLKVVDNLDFETFSTSNMLRTMEARGIDHNVLFIDREKPQESFIRSTSNIVGTKILAAMGANVYDIIKRDNLVLTVGAVAHLEEVLKPQ